MNCHHPRYQEVLCSCGLIFLRCPDCQKHMHLCSACEIFYETHPKFITSIQAKQTAKQRYRLNHRDVMNEKNRRYRERRRQQQEEQWQTP